MCERADAHAHFFDGGYQESFTGRPGVHVDEVACYRSLADDHGVGRVLAVTWEDAPWSVGNNEHVARLILQFPWIEPTAFIAQMDQLTIARLDQWRAQGFVGLSHYLKGDARKEAISRVHDDVWSWLVDHRWLVSVNARPAYWSAWLPVMARHSELCVLASHMGFAPKVSTAPDDETARHGLADLLALAQFPGMHVKLSGFYTATEPRHNYPHRPVWPYVNALLDDFGYSRLVWASDFPVCLDSVSFAQSLDVLRAMSFFNPLQLKQIEGGNLLALLDTVDRPR